MLRYGWIVLALLVALILVVPGSAQDQIVRQSQDIKRSIPGTSEDYQVTVDRLEEITGYDYFPELEDEVEEELEGDVSEGWGE